ncbi:PIN domain-containing protein [Mariniradius sediminis]|uniref:PIN domain-containing protein n=1 Tax=Mariniradius sediminis TaxID=2909237 RepID=A0ABS9BVU9_9BACT|nr:PIN domain-containing protein [Mariniradius sediminis]MCF1751710.1 PIN domain-containing protein [Mariniradius sediminis]
MRGVVLDTSVWIEYLRGNPDFFGTCQELLENGRVYGLELIFAELLQGARGEREIETILAFSSLVPSLDEPFIVIDSGLISQRENYVNQGVGLIDAVIVNAVRKNGLLLWTLDTKIRRVLGYGFSFELD